jgi:hypothetical protein
VKELQLSGQENNSVITVAKEVRETVNADGAVLLDIEQGLCFRLNPVGAKIWKMVKDGSSLDEMTDALEKEFPLPRTQLLGDICTFLKQLERMRLVDQQPLVSDKRGFLSRLVARNRSA